MKRNYLGYEILQSQFNMAKLRLLNFYDEMKKNQINTTYNCIHCGKLGEYSLKCVKCDVYCCDSELCKNNYDLEKKCCNTCI
jgi:hypothetical protein